MNRKFSSIWLLVVLLVVSLGVNSSAVWAGGASTNNFHFSGSGKGADAGWSNCKAAPKGASLCTDTYISKAEQVYKENRDKYTSPIIDFYQYKYFIDRYGNYAFLSDTYGFGEATISFDKKLTSASANAVVPLTTCKLNKQGDYICKDGGKASIDASWVGVGNLMRTHSNYHFSVLKNYTYNSLFKGSYREAIASGLVNGADLGSSYYGIISNSKWHDIYICHGDC